MTEMTAGLNLVLLGKTGAGKSSTGNTILGRQAFVAKKSSSSVTRDIAVKSGAVCELPVHVYDTPGFFDTEVKEQEIQLNYQNLFQKCESGICVFLLVIKADRFTEEERKTVEKIEKLLGEKRLEKTWILFTRGDELKDENTTIKEFIDDNEPLKNLVQKYDQRYHVFNNKSKKPTEQVQGLLKKILKPYLDTVAGVQEILKQNPLRRKIPENVEPAAPADSPSSRRIVLLGKSGVGKSAAGNTILGQKEFKSVMGMSSVTRECSEAHATVSGRSVSVVDTPGFFDTKMNHEDIAEEIARSVYISSPGPHAFLIVFPVNMRFTEQEQQIPQMIKMLFGEEMLKYSIILFTHGDQLEGKSVEKLIEENCTLRDVVQQCGGRYHIFNNKDQNNREQVNDLLQKIDTMIEQNGGGHYSNQMFEDAEKFRREEEERRKREEEQRKQQMEKEIQEEIERVRKDTEERIRAEMEAKVEKQSEEEQRKQRKEFEREMKKAKERIRAEYEAEQQKLKAERQKEEKRIQEERVKKEDGFMQFFSKHKRYFFWGAVVVGVAFGGAALGAYVAKALSGAAFAKACGVAVGGVVGGAAAGAVGGIASGEGAAKGAAVGAVAGTAVVGAIGGAYVGAAAAAKVLSGAAAAKACGVAVGGAVGGAAAGAFGVAAGGKDIAKAVGVIDQTVGGNVA